MSAYSLVDASGAYLANVIPKRGRNELQFYPLAQNPAQADGPVKRHELHTDSDIVAAAWLNEHVASSKKAAKRKADESFSEPSAASLLLAVALASGEVWVYSPTADQAVAKVACPAMTRLAASSTENHFWGATGDGDLVKMHALDGSTAKTVRFGKPVGVLAQAPAARKRRADQDLLLAGSARLYLVDGERTKKHVVGEFAEAGAEIAFVAAVRSDGHAVAVARAHSGAVARVDVSDPAQPPAVYTCSSTRVGGLRALGGDYVAAFTSKGADIFDMAEPAGAPVATVRASGGRLHNLVHAPYGLVAVWYDGVQPCFTLVCGDAHLEGAYAAAAPARRACDDAETGAADATFTADISFSAPTPEIANLPPAELVARLDTLVLAGKGAPAAALALCASNDDEDNIKDAVRRMSQARRGEALVARLFEAVAGAVARDPAHKSSLPVWLKWLLMVHGGFISAQPQLAEPLRKLQGSLDDGMVLMRKLLALQGRLQLLKSQAELRNKLGAGVAADENDAFTETFNGTRADDPAADGTLTYEDGEAE